MPTVPDDDITEVRNRPAAQIEASSAYNAVAIAPGHAIVTAGSYLIHISNGPADIVALRALIRANEQLCAQHPQFGFISLLTETADMRMTKEFRAELDAMVSRFSPRYAAAAVIFTGQGFAATAARSIVTSVNLSTQAGHPNRVFTDLDSALPWLREKFPAGTPDPAALRAIVNRLLGELAGMAQRAEHETLIKTAVVPTAAALPSPRSPREQTARVAPNGAARGKLRSS